MSGYFGSALQQRLQAEAEAAADAIAATPGACQVGRMAGCDDVDLLGRDRLEGILARDGVCGFRLIAADRIEPLRQWLDQRGFRFDTWDVYLGERAATRMAGAAILAAGLPAGYTELPAPTDADDRYTASIQSLMAGAGIAPFSGSLLTGAIGTAVTVVIGDGDAEIVATAHAYLPHNAHSPYHRYAWGGLVAVAEAHRGKGLGAYVNARIAAAAFDILAASHLYELVSPTNAPSQRMVTASGLEPTPHLVCGIATRVESTKFTR